MGLILRINDERVGKAAQQIMIHQTDSAKTPSKVIAHTMLCIDTYLLRSAVAKHCRAVARANSSAEAPTRACEIDQAIYGGNKTGDKNKTGQKKMT
jgi:hypothetical protein